MERLLWMCTYVFSHTCPSPHSGFDGEAREGWGGEAGGRIPARDKWPPGTLGS